MRIQLFYFILFLCLTSCNALDQESREIKVTEIHEDSLVLDKTKGIFKYQDRVFTGTSIQKYRSNTTSRSIQYVKGKKNGNLVMYYPNGHISYKATYNKGKLHGPIESWWKNGNKRSESSYKDGKVHGTQKQWYLSGEKFKVLHFAHGMEDGMQTAWRKNGKVYTNYQAKNGRIFGLKRANLCYSLEDEEVQFKD